MPLDQFSTFGRSGLVVSPLALGAMTFGREGWGADEGGSRRVFDAYLEAGGNFIDTAEAYSEGRSEELLGRFLRESGRRDRAVIATKSGWVAKNGGPNTGGNGAKNILRAVEGSLKRLGTDWVDLYWLHVWDGVTPAEEVLRTMGDLVRAGKIRYFGLSNVPAWYAARMATLAQVHNVPGPVALQLEYSLISRGIEWELLPAARELGLAVQPWSPLGAGLLTGKYRREDAKAGDGRLNQPNPFGDSLFTERNWNILDALRAVAGEAGCLPAQAALAWVMGRPGVNGTLVGARNAEQLGETLAAAELKLSPEQREKLDKASAPAAVNPYSIFALTNRIVFGTPVRGWSG